MTSIMMTPEVHPYHAWHERRVETCLAQLSRFLPAGRPLRALDLGHDPQVGPRLEALGLAVTGNVYPGSPLPEVSWALSPFDLEKGFPFPEASFDVVTAFEVIEHVVSTPRSLLRESARVLKPGGILYLGTPNVCAWAKVRRMFSQVHPYDAAAYSLDFGPHHEMCHVYEYEPWTLKQLVASEGFAITDCRTWDPYATDPRGVRNSVLRGLVSASLLIMGYARDGAQLWRSRGHQIGLVATRR